MKRHGWVMVLGALVGCGSGGGGASDAASGVDAAAGAPDAAVALADCGTDRARLDLDDVSFLIPLPTTNGAVEHLLALDSAGARGELLPQAIYDGILPLAAFSSPARHAVKILGIRIDPCVPGNAGASACRPQVRLVAQEVFTQDAAPPTTIDATIHLFYDLDAAALARVIDGVHALKAMAGEATFCQPLGPHPVIEAEGLDGAYAQALAALVLAEAGADTLVRVAVMQLSRSQTTWTFATVDVGPSGELVPFTVPLTEDDQQQFTLASMLGRGNIFPEAEGSRIALLVDPPALLEAPEAEARAAFDESLLVEDPTREHAGARDCVGCHISHRARASALTVRAIDLGAPASTAHDETVLETLDVQLRSQRMFGYFARDPSLSPRVVHETARVADYLDALE